MASTFNPGDHMAASAKRAVDGAMAAARAQVQATAPVETPVAPDPVVEAAPAAAEPSPPRPVAL